MKTTIIKGRARHSVRADFQTTSNGAHGVTRPTITAPLRAARAFDTALALVLDKKRINSQSRSLVICGPSDDDRLLLIAPRLNEIANDADQAYWAEGDVTREMVRANLQIDLANLAAFCLLWLTTGQRTLTRGCKAIAAERQRQGHLLVLGDIKADVASPATDNRLKFRVLFEECGEVAHAIDQVQHHGLAASNIYTELTQVAAVCVAWLESLHHSITPSIQQSNNPLAHDRTN